MASVTRSLVLEKVKSPNRGRGPKRWVIVLFRAQHPADSFYGLPLANWGW